MQKEEARSFYYPLKNSVNLPPKTRLYRAKRGIRTPGQLTGLIPAKVIPLTIFSF
jgi:hypothetical protein